MVLPVLTFRDHLIHQCQLLITPVCGISYFSSLSLICPNLMAKTMAIIINHSSICQFLFYMH